MYDQSLCQRGFSVILTEKEKACYIEQALTIFLCGKPTPIIFAYWPRKERH